MFEGEIIFMDIMDTLRSFSSLYDDQSVHIFYKQPYYQGKSRIAIKMPTMRPRVEMKLLESRVTLDWKTRKTSKNWQNRWKLLRIYDLKFASLFPLNFPKKVFALPFFSSKKVSYPLILFRKNTSHPIDGSGPCISHKFWLVTQASNRLRGIWQWVGDSFMLPSRTKGGKGLCLICEYNGSSLHTSHAPTHCHIPRNRLLAWVTSHQQGMGQNLWGTGPDPSTGGGGEDFFSKQN